MFSKAENAVISLWGRWGVSHPSTLALHSQVALLTFGKWSRCNWVPAAQSLSGQLFSALTLCIIKTTEMLLGSKWVSPRCTWAAGMVLSRLFSLTNLPRSVFSHLFRVGTKCLFTSIALNPQGCCKRQKPKICKMREIQCYLKVSCHLPFPLGDINYQEFAKRLWGDIYFNPKT